MTAFLGAWLNLMALFHPFYISLTDVSYKKQSAALEVSVRLFTDDFENALRKNCSCRVDLLQASTHKQMEQLVANYINRHLQIKVNGQAANLNFTGFQKEEESTWSYFEVKNVSTLKQVEIGNTLFHDYTQEQVNMIHLTINGKEQTEKLDYPANYFIAHF